MSTLHEVHVDDEADVETGYHDAYRQYGEARGAVTDATKRLLAQRVREAFPGTAALVAYGQYNEDGQISLRAQRLLDPDGDATAGWDANDEPIGDTETAERWDDELSSFDDLLDFIAQINDEDYLHDHTFVFVDPLPVSDSPGCQTAVVNWDDLGDDFAAAEVVLDLLDDDTNLPDHVVARIRGTISEVWPVEVRQRALKELAYSYGIEESDIETDDPARYALVEQNVGGSSPPYFVTMHSSPAEAGKYHVEQEYASDWEVDALVDLDTGQTFSAEVQPITFVPIEGT